MQMVHRLTAVFARIYNDTVSVRESLFPRNICSRPQQVAQQRPFVLASLVQGTDVLPRHNQHMHRRLWIYVGKRIAKIVLINRRRRDRSFNNLAE